MTIKMIWAQSKNNVIGKNNSIPWHLPEDFQYFKEQTSGGIVVMGRSTWESLPEKSKPLPNRVNYVLTRNKKYVADGAQVIQSIEEIIELSKNENVWIIGGNQIYRIFEQYAEEIHVTIIDVFVPIDDKTVLKPFNPYNYFQEKQIVKKVSESNVPYEFHVFVKK